MGIHDVSVASQQKTSMSYDHNLSNKRKQTSGKTRDRRHYPVTRSFETQSQLWLRQDLLWVLPGATSPQSNPGNSIFAMVAAIIGQVGVQKLQTLPVDDRLPAAWAECIT